MFPPPVSSPVWMEAKEDCLPQRRELKVNPTALFGRYARALADRQKYYEDEISQLKPKEKQLIKKRTDD
ncbi:hypothetical protein F7725_020206, partial [Dissostichus mawsoni]